MQGLTAESTKSGRLQRALLDLLRGPLHAGSGALPTSVRFLFYELLGMGVIEKHGSGVRRVDQDVSDALTVLRKAGLVPWEWIRDETRRLQAWALYDSISEGVYGSISTTRLNRWDGSPAPLILTESRSLAGVLQDIAYQYGVSIAATNGQVGGFLYVDLVPALSEGQRVIYFGDLDLSGGQIEGNTRRVLEEEVGPLAWERLALTPEQVREYNLPPKPKRDRRYADGHVHDAYETEALSQTVIQGLLSARLNELLPESLDAVQVREDEQRERVRARLEATE